MSESASAQSAESTALQKEEIAHIDETVVSAKHVPLSALLDERSNTKNARALYDNEKKQRLEIEAKLNQLTSELQKERSERELQQKASIARDKARELGVRDFNDVRGYLDFNTMKLNGESLEGLDERLKQLKEQKDYLFASQTTARTGSSSAPPASKSQDAEMRGVSRDELRTMTQNLSVADRDKVYERWMNAHRQ